MSTMIEKRNYRWIVLILLGLVTASGVYAQFQLSALAYKIIPNLGLTSSQFSSIFSAPMVPSILFSIIAGLLSDRFGAKRVIGVGLVIVIIGAVLRPTAVSYGSMYAYMAMTGVGVGFLNANLSKIIGTWFAPEKVGGMIGIVMSFSSVAMMLGTGTTAFFHSVTTAYITSAVICVGVGFLWLLLMRNKPDLAPEPTHEPISKSLGIVSKSRSIWVTGLALMLLAGGNLVLVTFLPTGLLAVHKNLNAQSAGVIASVMMVGSLAGSIAGPIVCHKIGRMRTFMFVLGLVAALGTAFVWQVSDSILIGVGLIVTGLAVGSLIPILLSLPMILPEIGAKYAGSAGGMIATLQLLGAVIIPTYVISPIAGTNYYVLFGLAAACMVCMSLVVLFLPDLRDETINGKSKYKQLTAMSAISDG